MMQNTQEKEKRFVWIAWVWKRWGEIRPLATQLVKMHQQVSSPATYMQMNTTLLHLCGLVTRLTYTHYICHIVLLALLQIKMQIAIFRLVHNKEANAAPLYQRGLATQDRHDLLSNPISGKERSMIELTPLDASHARDHRSSRSPNPLCALLIWEFFLAWNFKV